jgi:3-oxoadipate enol-lactonase
MPKVLFNGNNLWYELTGRGYPLTLIGGYGLLHNQWDYANQYLEPHCRVLNWNYRGAGKSDWTMTEPYTVEQWVEDMRAILDAVGVERTDVWATSTGSSIGIRFAAKYPERTRALITFPSFKGDHTWREIMKVSYQVTRTFGVLSLARLYAGVVLPPQSLYAEEGIEFEKFETKYFEKNVNLHTLEAVVNAYSKIDLTGDVRRLKCPTLLLLGDESRLNGQDSLADVSFTRLVEGFKKLKPDAEVAGIPHTGNSYCMIHKPKETVQVVIDYLNRINQEDHPAQ